MIAKATDVARQRGEPERVMDLLARYREADQEVMAELERKRREIA